MFPTPSSPMSSSASSSPYHNYGQQHTPIPHVPPVPSGQSGFAPVPFPTPVSPTPLPAQTPYEISRQQTAPQGAMPSATNDLSEKLVDSDPVIPAAERRKRVQRFVAIGLLLALLIALFFTWSTATPTASPTSSTQNFTSGPSTSNNSSAPGSTSSSGNTITVYVVGAVKHPGVYSLPADARVYQLLQAAGGPQANANLVALNLAAKLSDGEEVYVVHIGETPPTYYGGVPQPGPGTGNTTSNTQLININTASSDEMRQALHISSATAQAIINYRTQNGPFTSVDQLQQVVSQSIYDKIKNEVTV